MDIGSLLLGIGNIGANYFQGKAAADANAANVAAQEQQNAFFRDLINSGVIDPYGNIIGYREGDSGPLITELVGDTKTLADTGMANALTGEDVRSQFADVAGDLTGQFAGAPAVRAPVGLEGARNIVQADDARLRKAILNPAIANAQALAQRTAGDSTGKERLVTNFMERIMPQIQLGGEQRAMDLASKDRERFTGETLGLGEKALGVGSSGFQPVIPGAAPNLGAQAINRISTPTFQPDLTGAGLASGIGGVGAILRSDQEKAESNRMMEALIKNMSGSGQFSSANRGLGTPGGTI